MGAVRGNITELLNKGGGVTLGRDRVAEAVYGELRRIASRLMAAERPSITLQATQLATDAYMNLVHNQENVIWADRSHFFAAAACAMRHMLVDHSRRRRSQKRGGDQERVKDLDSVALPVGGADEVLALDQALDRLEKLDSQQCRVVELRYFGGLTEEDTAEVLGVSVRTVKRDWSVARAWLYAELTRGAQPLRRTPTA